ncbi:PREDICTED: uncharacterized protein LOC104586647 [Nelumbo nucifera]|uniref:C3H1-type domain-containing protein n=2 Tax=Nelumbo nucifera TaxID=4432 RepID=A0A822ZVI6_NELNU|nr:PREDICTED: uncharacterized protein LOC104586647 [Nelumbo nucifera]DAD49013.1 TPA_asm: hypothetical protein HUJ06_018950 [Nelumbo nucifera]
MENRLEKTKLETLKPPMHEGTPFVFPRHRRPLKSETFRTLVRILSHCLDECESSPKLQIVSPGSQAIELGQETQEVLHELVDPDRREPENLLIENTEIIDTNDETFSTVVKDGVGRRMVVEGNEDFVCDNVLKPTNVSTEKDLMVDDIPLVNDQSDPVVSEKIDIEKLGIIENDRHLNFEVLGATNLSMENSPTTEKSVSVNSAQNKISSLENSVVDDIPFVSDQSDRVVSEEIVIDKLGLIENDMHLNFEVLGASDLSVENNLTTEKSVSIHSTQNKTSLEKCVVDDIPLVTDQSDPVVSEEIAIEKLGLIENDRHLNFEVLGATNLSVENSPTTEKSVSINSTQNKTSSLEKNMMEELQHEIQRKEPNLKTLVPSIAAVDTIDGFVADREIEEGEISDDPEIPDQLIDSVAEDAVFEMQGKEEHVSADASEKEDFSNNSEKHARADGIDMPLTSYLENTVDSMGNYNEENFKEQKKLGKEDSPNMMVNNRNGMVEQAYKDGSVLGGGTNKMKGDVTNGDSNYSVSNPDNFGLPEKIHEKNITGNPGTSTEKDVKTDKKRKRSPLTQEKKAKKKLRSRKKRAEKNKLLGIKRLKIQPISKPKTVKYCNHYLKGRCQKGDLCRFSHDIIPLTKSQPCSYFARNSCLKGDECPFDHELSKYPCNNYVSKGSCIRGDKCMFSHKVPPKEVLSLSKVDKTQSEPTHLPPDTNSKKQLNIKSTSHHSLKDMDGKTNLGLPSSKRTLLQRNTQQNIVERNPKPLALAPEGIHFLSVGKTPSDGSSRNQEGDPPSKRIGDAKIWNWENQVAPEKHQSLNVMHRMTQHAVTPKGISFLSIGKASSSDFSKQQRDILPSKRDDGIESATNKHESSNDMLLRVPACPLSKYQSNPLVDGNNKNTPNSAQKALLSTLAFAAKYESEMMERRHNGPTALSMESGKNESMKASKILEEFLFGIGSSSKQ